MKVVVIGNTGFIGKNIYQNLEDSGEFELIRISTKLIDLTCEKSVPLLCEYFSPDDTIIMCAGVKKQFGDTLETFENNLAIINNFCRAVSLVPPHKIIFFSSASVYGEDVAYNQKISEITSPQPKTFYGISKYSAERLLENICSGKQTKLVILRPPLIYGKDDLSRGYGPTGFSYKVLNDEEIILWGDGSEYREFVYVDDVSRIVNRLIKNDYNGILNLVSGKSYNYKQVIDFLDEIIGKHLKVTLRARTKDKVDHYYSSELIHHVLGNFEFTGLRDGLRETLSTIG